jgi:NTE family protein
VQGILIDDWRSTMATSPTVAIACQGGGSHAAFAAGALSALLSPEHRERYRLVGLSGTSGGAMCAALAWSGLIRGGPAEARRRLAAFWRDLEARDVVDSAMNAWGVWLATLPLAGEVSPYLYEPIAEPRLRELLQRHLDLESLPADARRTEPRLLVGATDIVSGLGVAFEGEQLTYDDLIASAAIPPLFRAVSAHGTLFWDGLFTRNPPIRELTKLPEPPDEIWVIQIDPQRREREPRAMPEIVDRRNELSGNLALGQELYFVEKINELLAEHPGLRTRYKPIGIRVVELGLTLDYTSKFDRSAALIERLFEHGRERAAWFFEDRSRWPWPVATPAAA